MFRLAILAVVAFLAASVNAFVGVAPRLSRHSCASDVATRMVTDTEVAKSMTEQLEKLAKASKLENDYESKLKEMEASADKSRDDAINKFVAEYESEQVEAWDKFTAEDKLEDVN